MIRRKPTLEARITRLERLMNEAWDSFDELAEGVEDFMNANFRGSRRWPDNGSWAGALERLADGKDDEIIDELVNFLSATYDVDRHTVKKMRPVLLSIAKECAKDILMDHVEKRRRRPRRRF